MLTMNCLFQFNFTFDKKRGVDAAHWFTPSGKCKIYVGACDLNHLGKLGKGQYDKLMAMMKKAKNDALTDGTKFYTTGDNNIIEIKNLYGLLYNARNEWEERKEHFETYRNF